MSGKFPLPEELGEQKLRRVKKKEERKSKSVGCV